MNIISESTFEKHKNLMLEKLADDEVLVRGPKGNIIKQKKKKKEKPDKASRGWEQDADRRGDEKSSGDFSPNQFWNDFKEMPVSQFISQYGTVFTDPKIKDFLTAGGKDGDKKETFNVSSDTLPVSQLVPSQNEIGFGNSIDDLCMKTFGLEAQLEELKKILQGENVALAAKGSGPLPIIVFAKKYVIDGHHRWSKLCCGNKDATASVLNFEATGVKMDVEQVLKAFHLAIAARIGKIPVEDKSGANLIGSNPTQVKMHVLGGLDKKNPDSAKFIAVYRSKNLTSAEQISDYIAENAQVITNITPATNTPRSGMPQTDQAKGYEDALKTGNLNFAADAQTAKMVQENNIAESTFNKFKKLFVR